MNKFFVILALLLSSTVHAVYHNDDFPLSEESYHNQGKKTSNQAISFLPLDGKFTAPGFYIELYLNDLAKEDEELFNARKNYAENYTNWMKLEQSQRQDSNHEQSIMRNDSLQNLYKVIDNKVSIRRQFPISTSPTELSELVAIENYKNYLSHLNKQKKVFQKAYEAKILKQEVSATIGVGDLELVSLITSHICAREITRTISIIERIQ